MKKTFFSLILILSNITFLAAQNNDQKSILKDEFIDEEISIPSVHSPTIAETPDGLIVAFFGGQYEGHADVGIFTSKRTSTGWTKPVLVIDGSINENEKKACYNPVLYQVPGEELILFYKVGSNVQDWTGYLIRSFDHGKSWSKPEQLPNGYLGPVKNKPLLIDNDLLCGASTENDGWKVHFEHTSDKGKTWSKTESINGSEWGIIQPSILQHKNGKLQMVCRSQNEAVVTSFSDDNGYTWSEPTALDLPNNNTGIDATTLNDGRFLMVYNHVKAKESAYIDLKRTPLNIAISDDGLKWEKKITLVDSPIKEYSYPSVIQSADSMIHIVYTWRRENIRYVKLDPMLIQ